LRFSRTIILAGFCVAVSAVHAETAGDRYGEEYQTCRDGNTHDIVTCLTGLYKKWDARVDAAYKKLLGMAESPKSRTALETAQKSWLKFRDDNCEWYETGEGTIRRLWGSECMRSLTAARALELEEAGETH
jgi:uncharacterized protein YecT (DUF1311 family)